MDTLISPRRRKLLQAIGCTALLSACGQGRLVGHAQIAKFSGLTMGSTYSVQIVDTGLSTAALQAARTRVEAALNTVDFAMSTHRTDSALSRFNAHAETTPYSLSDDLFDVFSIARSISQVTNGAFDITVGPMVDAWGFGGCRHRRLVSDDERADMAQYVGWQHLKLDRDASTATKLHSSLRADLSGVAKGYGVDKAAQALDELGIRHYLIDTGGEVRTRGTNARGQPWQVAIEQPYAGPRRPRRVVPLEDMAIATSGDYRIFFEQGGRRYSHEINPATGQPIDKHLASVSVVAATGATADALGKLIVLGLERAYALAESQQIAAHFIVRSPDGSLHDVMTPAFQTLGSVPYAA